MGIATQKLLFDVLRFNIFIYGLNCTKEIWDNARVQINSALIVFMPCFNITSFCVIIRSIIIKNFFDILKLFDFLNF